MAKCLASRTGSQGKVLNFFEWILVQKNNSQANKDIDNNCKIVIDMQIGNVAKVGIGW